MKKKYDLASLGCCCFITLFTILFWGCSIYVVGHFVIKFW